MPRKGKKQAVRGFLKEVGDLFEPQEASGVVAGCSPGPASTTFRTAEI